MMSGRRLETGSSRRFPIQTAFREVDDALASYAQLRREREALQRVVDASRERLRLAELRYRGGVTIYLEVSVYEITLPQGLLRANETPVEMQWVDYWR